MLPKGWKTGVGSAESCVKDKRMVLEMIIDVTNASLGSEGWCSPSRSVWICAGDVRRLSFGVEAPHLDEVAGPFHCNDSSTDVIECLSVI